MERTITLSHKEMKRLNELLQMTGDEIYQKLGLKRDETYTKTAVFPNGITADIKMVIGESNDKPYTEGILFKDGSEIQRTDPDEEFEGVWEFEYEGTQFNVIVEEMKDEDHDEKKADIKRELFMSGSENIDEFVGRDCSDLEKDAIDNLFDQVLDGMSYDEFNQCYTKYVMTIHKL